MTTELSSKTIQIINDTADIIVGKAPEITTKMYELLFLKYPQIKKLFENQPDNQFMVLAEALSLFAVNIKKLDKLKPALEVIAISHVEVNVKAGHYPMIGMVLLEAMEDVLKEKATVDFMDAWREAYQYLANVLIDMEAKMYKEIEN